MKEFKIIYTSDVHGHIFPVNYSAGKPENSGLLNLAAQVKKDGNTLILDGGDTLQGTPLSQYYLRHQKEFSFHPMAEGFNALECDYFTLGNHDFNFGFEAVKNYLDNMKGTCLCANVKDLSGELKLFAYKIHVLENGLRVGITGIVTDFVKIWERPEHLEKIRILDAFETAEEQFQILKPQCDLTICIYHGGFEEDLDTGRLLSRSGENVGCRIAREVGYDLLLTGHQHMTVEGRSLCGTYTVQCPANAQQFFRISGRYLEREKRTDFFSEIEKVGSKPVKEVYERLLPLEKKVQKWLDEPVGFLQETIMPQEKLQAALFGSSLAELFNQVQLARTQADFSCTSLGNEPAGLDSAVTMRGISSAYLFANTLVVLEVDEAVLKTALERCAAYFEIRNGQPRISQDFLRPKIEHYNYDFYSGLDYAFDLTKPVGQRVTRLRRKDGTSLGNRKYSLVTSNYRATGTGGYEILAECPVLWKDSVEMQELIAEYIKKRSPLKAGQTGYFMVKY